MGCSVPYYPAAPGQISRYAVSSSGKSSGLSVEVTSVKSGDITLRETTPHSTLKTELLCNAAGISSVRGGILLGNPTVTSQFKTGPIQGVLLPAGPWRVGLRWRYSYAVRSQSQSGNVSVGLKATVTVTSVVVGEKRVSTPAGSFESEEVKSTELFSGTEQAAGQAVPFRETVLVTSYYSERVGLVEQISRLQGPVPAVTTTLVAFQP